RGPQGGRKTACCGNAASYFHNRNRNDDFVKSRAADAIENQSRVLLIVAINQNQIEALVREPFNPESRLGGVFESDLEFIEDLSHGEHSSLIAAEHQRANSHIVRCYESNVISNKLPW